MSLPERRDAYADDPVLAEDRRLFRTNLVRIAVDVTPERRRSPRGDLILRGYVAGKEIEVVFPGRRHAAAVPLLHRLQKLLHRKAEGSVALPLRVDGCWRVRMYERDGIADRRYQLVAARWHFRGTDGVDHIHGELPLA